MKKIILPIALLFFSIVGLSAQVGGLFTYEFLNFAPSARVSALGGTHIAVADDDVNLAANNPALLNPSMHQQLSFSHAFHLGDINYGYVAGGFHHKKIETTFHAGIRYVNYGQFDQTNTLGQVEGEFKAAEYGITIGAARTFSERFSGGLNLKLVTSQLESYNSLGLVADAGLLYQDTARNLSLTILARNAGTQLSQYTEGNSEPLPFEMQVGIAKRLKHLPFRLSLIYRYFDRWNILYDDPNSTEDILFLDDTPNTRSNASIWLDNFARHFVFNGELLMGQKENFRLRFGYSHLLRKELTLAEFRSLAGFTFGAGMRINRFHIDYGRTNFHLAGGVNQLSISTNLKEFK